MDDRASLASVAAALNLRQHVERANHVGQAQRQGDRPLVRRARETLLQRLAVDDDVAEPGWSNTFAIEVLRRPHGTELIAAGRAPIPHEVASF